MNLGNLSGLVRAGAMSTHLYRETLVSFLLHRSKEVLRVNLLYELVERRRSHLRQARLGLRLLRLVRHQLFTLRRRERILLLTVTKTPSLVSAPIPADSCCTQTADVRSVRRVPSPKRAAGQGEPVGALLHPLLRFPNAAPLLACSAQNSGAQASGELKEVGSQRSENTKLQ